MRKRKKQIKIPAAKFGLEQIGNIAEQLPNAVQLLSNPFQKSTATSSGEAVAQSINGIMSGASTGSQIGSPLGTAGKIAGATIGAAVGLIGKRGEEAEMTSFTDYDEGTLGTGLTGLFGNSKLKKRRERIKKNAYNNRAAVQGTEQLASDYDMEYGDLDTTTFNSGGTTGNSLVYVDDGELLRTPDGSIHEVAEQGKPTDSNLLNLPNGSRILSDSLKVPGTSETFANAGKRIMKNKKSIYNDKYSENAQKLNDINNQLAYDKLFALQESVKKQKGIKPKTKKLVQAADNGDEVKQAPMLDLLDETVPEVNSTTNDIYTGIDYGYNWIKEDPLNPKWEDTSGITYAPLLDTEDIDISVDVMPNLKMSRLSGKPTVSTNPSNTMPKSSYPEVKPVDTSSLNKKKSKDINFDATKLINGLTGLAEIVPALSNIFSSKDKPVQANYNPYANATLKAARGRRYNINPYLRDIERNRAISNYNASQMNTNTGASMAFRLANAVNTDRASANVRAQQSNINNQYLGEYANIANNLGQQWVGATNLAEDMNRKQIANTRNIRRTGMSQLSQWAQNKQLMRNQINRDNAMLALYGPYLEGVFTKSTMDDYRKWLQKGGNSWA